MYYSSICQGLIKNKYNDFSMIDMIYHTIFEYTMNEWISKILKTVHFMASIKTWVIENSVINLIKFIEFKWYKLQIPSKKYYSMMTKVSHQKIIYQTDTFIQSIFLINKNSAIQKLTSLALSVYLYVCWYGLHGPIAYSLLGGGITKTGHYR